VSTSYTFNVRITEDDLGARNTGSILGVGKDLNKLIIIVIIMIITKTIIITITIMIIRIMRIFLHILSLLH